MDARPQELTKAINEAADEIDRIDGKRIRTDADMDRIDELFDRIDAAKAELRALG